MGPAKKPEGGNKDKRAQKWVNMNATKKQEKLQRQQEDQQKQEAAISKGDIPWPDIYKQHLETLREHARTLENVQSHTEADSENASIIAAMVERSKEMVSNFKIIERDFSLKEQVLPDATGQNGSQNEASSTSGPGGEPRDGLKRKRDSSGKSSKTNGHTSEANDARESTKRDTMAGTTEDNPFFVVDSNPTPVTIPERLKLGTEPASTESRKAKKQKTEKASKEAPTAEFEDISPEVEARLKAKQAKYERQKDNREQKKAEQKRRADERKEKERVKNAEKKEARKRKRESAETAEVQSGGAAVAEADVDVEEPARKSKKEKDEGVLVETDKKDKKKRKETKQDQDTEELANEEGLKPKKKRKSKHAEAESA
ncbi:MAG: DNA-directed DNA polymerase delta [Chaenotheca gracillima]|nr:MAG: DNA-directed DNA polymerase delta [Chaenotheca gracillima]